jgi:hypothetical protein
LKAFRLAKHTALTTDPFHLPSKTLTFIQHNFHQIHNHIHHLLRILLPSIPYILTRKGIAFLEGVPSLVGYLVVGDLLFLPPSPLPKVTLQKHDINVCSSSYVVPGYYNRYNMQRMTMGMQNMQLGQSTYSPKPEVGYTCTSGQVLFQKSRPSETQR